MSVLKSKTSDKYERILRIFRRDSHFEVDVIFYMEKVKEALIKIRKLLEAMDYYYELRLFSFHLRSNIMVLRHNIYNSAQETIDYTIKHILREVFGVGK